MGSLMEKARSSLRERGLAGTALHAAGTAARRLSAFLVEPRTILQVEKGDLERVPAVRVGEGYSCRQAEGPDMERFSRIFTRFPRKRGLFPQRLDKGQTCLACFREGEVVGYIWVSFLPERDRELGIDFHPDAGQSYGFDLYVLPEHRKENVGYALLAAWIEFSRRQGKTSCVGYVAQRNKPMLLTVRLVFGFKPVASLRTLTFLGRYGRLRSSSPWREDATRNNQGG